MILLIAEKPSAAREYQTLLEKVEGESFTSKDGYLSGRNYNISWCVGHLVGLAQPSKYGWEDWNLEDLPMIPETWEYTVLEDTKKQFKVLEGLINKADEVINGSDAGREGELIYRLAMMKAGGLSKPQRRLWLNSFVLKDMVKAWGKMKDSSEYNPLFFAAVVRQKADWLIGMNCSRLYSLTTGVRGLSVGRVQTPTLGLIVNRDLEILNWKDKYYFQLHCSAFGITWLYYYNGDTNFTIKETLEEIKNNATGQTGVITIIEKENKKKNPEKPFDLSGLQKEANKRFGFKAADTLKYTQGLYEKKLVSYPRTDSAYLPETMYDEAFEILNKTATDQERAVLRSDGKFAFFNSSKVTDHYAVIPTGETAKNSDLSKNETSIYELIRERFVMAFGKPKLWEETNLVLEVQEHHFVSRINNIIDPGYTALKNEEKENKDDAEQEVTGGFNVVMGDKDTCKDLTVVQKKVTKPKKYTEATLITAMETAGRQIEEEELKEAMKGRGLGTPATKASIIELLKKREYIHSEGRYLVSTPKGRQLIDLVDERVKSPDMTGEWEYKLSQMENGEYDWRVFYEEIEEYVTNLTETAPTEKAAQFQSVVESKGDKCPKCKKGNIKKTDIGWFCNQGKEVCDFALWPTVAKKKLTTSQMNQLLTKGKTGKISGFKSKEGKSFSASLKLVDGKVQFEMSSSKKISKKYGKKQ